MALLDTLKAAAGSIDPEKVEQVKKLIAGIDFDKIDVVGIAKKVGIPEEAVKAIVAQVKAQLKK